MIMFHVRYLKGILHILIFPMILSKELVTQVFVRDNSVLHLDIYCKQWASQSSEKFCAVSATENSHDIFVFSNRTSALERCSLCLYCPEGGGVAYSYNNGDTRWGK